MSDRYDDLTPAQKAKMTRIFNKLDDQKYQAYRIQFETYQAKRTELWDNRQPELDQIDAEYQAKLAELAELQKEAEEARRAKRGAIIDQITEQYKPEADRYQEAYKMALEWQTAERKRLLEAFWAEIEAGK